MDVERLLAVGLDLRVALSVRLAALSYASYIRNKIPIGQRFASHTVPHKAPAGMLRLIYGLRWGCYGGNAARARRAVVRIEKISRIATDDYPVLSARTEYRIIINNNVAPLVGYALAGSKYHVGSLAAAARRHVAIQRELLAVIGIAR